MTWVRDLLDAPPVVRGALVAVLCVVFLMIARQRAHEHVAGALDIQADAHRAHVELLRERIELLQAELEDCRDE